LDPYVYRRSVDGQQRSISEDVDESQVRQHHTMDGGVETRTDAGDSERAGGGFVQ
jgi:hypothetical protein